MFRRSPNFGFTLLEILLAVGVVLVVTAVAVPAMKNAWTGRSESGGRLAQWDAWAREAHERGVAERRAYVIAWEGDGTARLRPAQVSNEAEARGLKQWKPRKDEKLAIEFPSALGKVDAAKPCWTFWPEGGCEAARLTFSGAGESWSAAYDPLTCRREETRHD